MSENTCIIIGASHAAAQLAPSLRQGGWQGPIIVIGEETSLPYHRPPLSKEFLAGKKQPEDMLIRHAALYEKADIQFRLGMRVTSIVRAAKTVQLDNGEVLQYDKLALATGSRVRQIPLSGVDLAGVCYLRNLNDVENIKNHVQAGKKAVIVGGGYIGLETAAVLNQLGMHVTVLEMMSRILERVTAVEVSEFYHRIHTEEGVSIKTNVTVSAFKGEESVQQVVCKDGQSFDADLVVIGVGILPNVELAEAAGLKVDNGITVDEFTTTSDKDIVAVGDCTNHHNAHYDRHIRLESVQNAVEQAQTAAMTLCGIPKTHNALPWFWSDQYDLKLQIAGLSQGYDDVVIRGDIHQSRSFAAFYLSDGEIIAVDAVNRPKEFMMGKRLIMQKARLDKNQLADEAISMKELVELSDQAAKIRIIPNEQ